MKIQSARVLKKKSNNPFKKPNTRRKVKPKVCDMDDNILDLYPESESETLRYESESSQNKYDVTVTHSGNVYGIQFDKVSYLKFQKDPSYVKQFLPTEMVSADGEITAKLTGLIDGETSSEIDLNIDPNADKCCNDQRLVEANKEGTFDSTTPANGANRTDKASQSILGHSSNRFSVDPNRVRKQKTSRKAKVKLNTMLEGDLLDDAEAHLLQLAFDRPVLFDYTLPIAERNPNSLINTWSLVHKKMNEYIKDILGEKANNLEVALDAVRETWLNIRTQYMRYRSNTKNKTGMSPNKTPPIKHLDLLRNYETVAMKRRTLSNMDENDDTYEQYDDEYAERRVNEAKPTK
ncbi:hypothetical protein Bhyg_12041 [Pseudolycoriella hygida]|uniref:MADF domain-containing protein n=1 Tax=Pseudolycoriella hygida TaxID=35572 RepID=A0A9Q0S0T9_9DIPT|nr:hypothetical protein Bhyg_12041 [Pseudolycoriella hygida]